MSQSQIDPLGRVFAGPETRVVSESARQDGTVRYIYGSLSFGQALCQHFGLSAGKVLDVKINTEQDTVFSASLVVALSAEDLAGIAERMKSSA